MAAHLQDQPQFSDNESIESAITYQEQESRARPASEYAHAIGCVQSVRNVFGGNGEGYLHFLATIKDFGVRRITAPVLVSRLKLLFSEHQELIEEINDFLPEEFIIALPLTRRGDISIEGTVSYVNKVKVAFSQEGERCVSFLQLIAGYREAEMSLQELSEQMCELLSDRQDLLEEFFDCMPSRREALQHAALKSAMEDRSIIMKMKPTFLFSVGVAVSVLVALVLRFAITANI